MDNFVLFAWMGGTSVGAILIWRLFVAIETQRKLEGAIADSSENLELERQELSGLMENQTEAIEALTQENSALKQQADQHRAALMQLQADHQTLQDKYAELEQDLLSNIANGKTLAENLHAQKLEQARLHRQVESSQARQSLQEKEQKNLLQKHQKVTNKNQLYQQAVEAAKVKIEQLTREKKQLERDLQQALYQVVALEQEQQVNLDNVPSAEIAVSVQPSAMAEPSLPSFR